MGMDIRVWDIGWNKLNQAQFIYRGPLGRGLEFNVVLQGDYKGF